MVAAGPGGEGGNAARAAERFDLGVGPLASVVELGRSDRDGGMASLASRTGLNGVRMLAGSIATSIALDSTARLCRAPPDRWASVHCRINRRTPATSTPHARHRLGEGAPAINCAV